MSSHPKPSSRSGALRRALHQALDIVLDALEAEGAEEPKKKRSRITKEPPLPDIKISPETMARAEARWERAGWKKVG